MKTYIFFVSLCISTTYMMAQDTQLIDRELFFGNPEISGGQLSPDGNFISFMKEYEGIMNIWVKKIDEPFDAAKPLTNSKRPLYGYFWTIDGKFILYAKDNDGDENINIFAVDPWSDASEKDVPQSRNLTQKEEVTARIYNVSKKNPDKLIIGLNDRDKAWHDLYELTISTGDLKLIYENTERITSYDFDWDETLRVMNTTDQNGNTKFLYKKDNDLVTIYETNVNESAYISGWNEDNSKLYLVTNKGDLNLKTLYQMEPETKTLELVESDPLNRVDFGGLFLDKHTRKPIHTSYTDDKTRYYWKNEDWKNDFEFLQEKFPGREVSISSTTEDYQKWLFSVWGDQYVGETWYFDRKSRDLIHQYTPRPKLKEVEEALSPMKPIHYLSSDGLEISGYLTIPCGKEAKNLPVVVLVHGGPKGPRDYWGYDAQAQFLANRGYAVLQPNFRASGGYGKAFLNAGDLQWGKLMQDDITWGVKYLINEGIADKNRVGIMGGSYGGYATLAGLAFTPDVYACGVDIVGPSNLFTLIESIPPYWEAARAYLHAMVGDPDTEEGQKLMREASPLFSADKIDRPLLIIQGANDPRVKQAEADQIAIALRDKGKKIDYILADDEGHGFAKPVNRMAMYAETEKFLAELLGGRYQEDMPEDVAKRLEEMRVDVTKVTYEPKDKPSLSVALPDLNSNLQAGTHDYAYTMEVQGQKLEGNMVRTISQENGIWKLEDVATLPMGESKDVMFLKPSLHPTKRSMMQMGNELNMTYTDNAINMSMMGKDIPLTFEGAMLSDGPALDITVGAMPLEKGYSFVAQMPDLTSGKAKTVQLEVLDMEKIDAANCYKVKIHNLDNENDVIHLWINPATKMAEKITQVLPMMGNAVMTILKK